MYERILTVQYISTNNSFCCVSSNIKNLKPGNCIKVEHGQGNIAYLSIGAPVANLPYDKLAISAQYATALGIQNDDVVSVSEIGNLQSVSHVTICAINQNDYEILEMFSETIQSTLLDQIRVVNALQKMVIWVGSNISLTVLVDEVKPISPGSIDNLTEVVIKPPENQSSDIKKSRFTPDKIQSMSDFFQFLDRKKTITKTGNYDVKMAIICRLVPLKDLNLTAFQQPFNVFMRKNSLEESWSSLNSFQEVLVCTMTPLTIDNYQTIKCIYVRLCFFEDFPGNFPINSYEKNLFVNDFILAYLNTEVCSRVELEFVQKPSYVNRIQINTNVTQCRNIEEKFKIFLADNSDERLLLNQGVVIDIGDKVLCSLEFFPSQATFCVVDDKLVRNCRYSVQDDPGLIRVDKPREISEAHYANYSNSREITEKVLRIFSNYPTENILITGKQGVGKSTLLKIISEKLHANPNYIHIETIDCKKIKGKTFDSLHKILTTAFSKLVLNQPACLVLDDLHVLCENAKGDDMSPNTVYFNRISELVQQFLLCLSKTNIIGVLATAESTDKLNQLVYSSRGRHIFKNVYLIGDLSKNDRRELLEYFFKDHHLDFEQISIDTDGFVIEDIVNFVNKTLFEMYKDECENGCAAVTTEHCKTALKNTSILSLHDVHLHSAGTKDFTDVGGLTSIKKTLVESLLWPVKYSSLFANAPLRLQSGLLLYGPPGTGKTLLAGAAAKQCGLRLISIKGPELLSKYIGASEQAVRDVFQKAQSAKPCILFFDEFDSLAPRRGHDSTGVTDRVVNQLLTQLDGVESLTGVCVLAATSRPDLLDPALLRPGRLDKQLLCPLPDLETRLETFKVLSRGLVLEEDVDWGKIAGETKGYSGADLQSILYTAQMSCVGSLDEISDGAELEIRKISQKDLEEALRKTRPSLTRQERLKYDRIYAKFQGGSMENFKYGSKATLA